MFKERNWSRALNRCQRASKNRLNVTQEQYNRSFNAKVYRNPAFKADKMVYIETPSLTTSSANNSESLDATSYDKLMIKVMMFCHCYC